MGAIQSHPPDLGNRLEPWVHGQICHFIVLPVDEKSLDVDLVRVLPALVAFDRTNDDKLCRTLNGQIHSRVVLEVFVACLDIFREWVEAGDEVAPKDLGCLLKFLALVITLAVTFLEGFADVFWQLEEETFESLDVE